MENRLYTYRHTHPAVVTECVVFGYDGESLFLLLIERGRDPLSGTSILKNCRESAN